MTEITIERVAELLAKVGGTWFPERAALARKPVTSRQREVARLILAEIERAEAAKRTAASINDPATEPSEADERSPAGEHTFCAGETVEYCPPGDKRTVTCRIEKLDRDRAYLVSVGQDVGWVSTHTFLPLRS